MGQKWLKKTPCCSKRWRNCWTVQPFPLACSCLHPQRTGPLEVVNGCSPWRGKISRNLWGVVPQRTGPLEVVNGCSPWCGKISRNLWGVEAFSDKLWKNLSWLWRIATTALFRKLWKRLQAEVVFSLFAFLLALSCFDRQWCTSLLSHGGKELL